jgi:DNA-binding MarR family transcriptional regulator
MSQTRLGELTQIEKSSMVLFLDSLEAGRWVARKGDPKDRRAHIVRMTPEGRRKFVDLGPRLLTAQQHFLKPLSGAEIKALTEMLKRLSGSRD